jgi:hypothetical protein
MAKAMRLTHSQTSARIFAARGIDMHPPRPCRGLCEIPVLAAPCSADIANKAAAAAKSGFYGVGSPICGAGELDLSQRGVRHLGKTVP